MRVKRKIRHISVMEIQNLPPGKIIDLIERFNEGEIALVSIYRSRLEQIGLKSPVLQRFVKKIRDGNVGEINILMRKLSRRWHNEDQKGLSAKKKRLDKKAVSASSPPGFHSSKVL